jgi:hypothetical protein
MVSHRVRQEEAGNGANSASSLSTEKLPWRLGGAHFGDRKRPLSNWSYMRPYCTLVGSRFDHRMLAQPPVHLAYHVGGEAIHAAVLHLSLFWTDARRENQSVFDDCTQSRRFLAEHDVGGTGSGLAEQAGDDLAFAAVLQIQRQPCLGDFSRA